MKHGQDFEVRKSCRKQPFVARGLAPVGLRSSPKPCEPISSDTPQRPVLRRLRHRTGASPLATVSASGPTARLRLPKSLPRVGLSLTSVGDRVSQPLRLTPCSVRHGRLPAAYRFMAVVRGRPSGLPGLGVNPVCEPAHSCHPFCFAAERWQFYFY
jgi:hypothetical protein